MLDGAESPEASAELAETLAGLDHVLHVDAAALVMLRDAPSERCGLARLRVDDENSAVQVANDARTVLFQYGVTRHRFVDVQVPRVSKAAAATPGGGWATTSRTSTKVAAKPPTAGANPETAPCLDLV